MYFLKKKYEFFETFKVFKALVENMSGNKIKDITRTKNWKEYFNKNLQHLYEECGILMQHSVPYTPQQNGVPERKNRALREMATCMMEDKDLSRNIWDESIKNAAYF